MKKAAIDIGINAIKCTLAHINREGRLIPLMDRQRICRLGEGLPITGELDRAAMDRNLEAVNDLVKMVKRRGARQILLVGTMALRMAENAGEFAHRVEREIGIRLRILTGEEEAYYSYLAVYAGLPILKGSLLLFDTGGGSTEFILGRGEEIEESFSLNVGAVTISEGFFLTDPVKAEEHRAASSAIEAILRGRTIERETDVLVGMGGAVTTLGAVMKEMEDYDSTIIHGLVLTRSEVNRQVNLYKEKRIEERKTIRGLHPKRADVILGGSCIVKAIMDLYHQERLIISDWGLRHGLLYDSYHEKVL